MLMIIKYICEFDDNVETEKTLMDSEEMIPSNEHIEKLLPITCSRVTREISYE